MAKKTKVSVKGEVLPAVEVFVDNPVQALAKQLVELPVVEPVLQFIMLVGLPGSGKSTWVKEFVKGALDNYVIISTDEFIDEYAAANNVSYNEAFKLLDLKEVEKKMYEKLEVAVYENKHIIWDQTNTSVKTRAKKLSKIPNKYMKYAKYFDISEEDLNARLYKRAKEEDKFIPHTVLQSMKDSLVEPSTTEGFNYIL
jgi:predicted kinase